jgi:hypothetical protein
MGKLLVIVLGGTGQIPPELIQAGGGHTLMKLLGIISVGFDITDQIFCIPQILEKKWEYNQTIHQHFIDFKKAYNSVRREVLYISS